MRRGAAYGALPALSRPARPLAAGVRPAVLFRCFIESESTNDPETAQTAEIVWCYNGEDLAAYKDEAPAPPPLDATSDDDALAEGAAFAPGDRVDARYKKQARWYPGYVTKVVQTKRGTTGFRVHFDDGDTDVLPAGFIRQRVDIVSLLGTELAARMQQDPKVVVLTNCAEAHDAEAVMGIAAVGLGHEWEVAGTLIFEFNDKVPPRSRAP